MYKNFLIVASKKDKAGINITTALSQYKKYDFYLVDDEIIYDSNYNQDKINRFDFVIFASRHKSEKGGKTLSIHAPGNWKLAEFGGEPGKVCPTSALFLKQAFEKLNKNVKEHDLRGYQVTLECTHHGPLINKPCMFIEIGSTEKEWDDRRAAFIVAKTINQIIDDFKENPYNEIAFAIGGPHYCPNFNKIQLDSNFALSHIIPEYSLPLTEEMVKEAINKTEEEVDVIILDWKGLGKAEDRQKVMDVLKVYNIPIKKTSEVLK